MDDYKRETGHARLSLHTGYMFVCRPSVQGLVHRGHTVSYGPWKLCGLPGLIIKAETADGDYRFTLAGIEKVKEDKDICLWKREFITKAKDKVRLQEKMLLTRPDEIMDWLGISYTTVSYDGSKVKLKFFTYDNPLEKDEQ